MADDRLAVLSALVDGEPVDPDTLRDALREPLGVDRLLDFARLRWDLQRDDARPSNEAERAILRRLVEAEPYPRRSARRVAAAAVLAAALFAAGGLLGRVRSRSDGDRPPIPTRVVRFEPGVDWHTVPEVKR